MSKEMKKKKKNKTNPAMIIIILFSMACGWFGAEFMSSLQENYFVEYKIPSYVIVIYLMVIFFVSLFITPLIHETGHLVMGLLTGYEFVSFRVGSFTLIKENGKLIRKKFDIAGTGGQCILTYKEEKHPENIPFFWYHFGGVFFNFLTAIISVPVVFLVDNPFVKVGFAMLAAISFVLGLMNIIPTNSMGMPNDGYNLVLLKKSPIDRVALYKLLRVNANQYNGIKLEDMPIDLITFSDEEKKCESGNALKVVEANIMMNRHNFKGAEVVYKDLSDLENLPTIYKNECLCELMYCMIMNGKSKEEIDKIFDKELKQYINVTGKTYVMRKRLMYAYYRFMEKDDLKANNEYETAKKMETTYPARGEYYSEMELFEYMVSIN